MDRPALILIPVVCCMLRWMLLGSRVGLGNLAGQSAMRVAGVHIPCMGTCVVTLAILLALLRWHMCVMT